MATTTSIRFDDQDYEWLRQEAFRRKISMARIIAELIDYARAIQERER